MAKEGLLEMIAGLNPVKKVTDYLDHVRKVQDLIDDGFAPKVPITFEKNNFLIKTADSKKELEQVLKLRYQVFFREFGRTVFPFGWDMDRFDSVCDHLVIIDKEIDRVVGTYRLISSGFSKEFYSEDEFVLKNFTALPDVKLELGRACIHKDYRTGAVMAYLWRGLSKYLNAVDAKFLFGCTSVKTMEPQEVALVYKHLLDGGHLSNPYEIIPTLKFTMPGLEEAIARVQKAQPTEESAAKLKELLPPLLQSYLRAGAKVCGEPALDVDFKCVDFFTILQVDQMTKQFERKYQV